MRALGLRNHADEFLDRFRHSEIPSPDRFLENYPEYTEVGKFAIAEVLTSVETDANVFPVNKNVAPWYLVLLDDLELDNRNFRNNALTILTFNYDRSLEFYIWKVIEARYKGDTRKIRHRWANKPRIIHLHGQLGAFDPVGGSGRQFRAPNLQTREGLSGEAAIAANGIQIIHEVDADTDEFNDAEDALRQAQRIYFLGFGFDKRNVQRLRVFEDKLDGVEIAGTGQGLSNLDQGRIQADVFSGHTNGRAFTTPIIRNFLEAADLSATQ